jgi:hypothetical protein
LGSLKDYLPITHPLFPVPGAIEGSNSAFTGVPTYGIQPAVVLVMFLCYCQYMFWILISCVEEWVALDCQWLFGDH